jgi:hypothetical protein
MFKHDPEEVDLWLNALPQNFVSWSSDGSLTLSSEQESVLCYLDNCFTRFGKAQYRYTDQLVELVGNVTKSYNEKYNLQQQEQNERHIISQSLIGGSGFGLLGDNNNNNTSDYTHPFSPLLLVLLELLQFTKTDKLPLVRFVTRLFLSLQSKQKLPFYLEALAEKLMQAVELKPTTTTNEEDMGIDGGDNQTLVGTWDIWNMVRQVKVCLNEGFAAYEKRDQGNSESSFDIISSM